MVEPYTVRTVEPWGVLTARGRWYLVGHDRDRDANRIFRLSCITDVKAVGSQGISGGPTGSTCGRSSRCRSARRPVPPAGPGLVMPTTATALRRAGRVTGRRTLGGRRGDVVELDVGGVDGLARGDRRLRCGCPVLHPDSSGADVLARLRAQAGTGA